MFSFTRRRKQIGMWSAMGCIIDLTNTGLQTPESDLRASRRSNRSIPVLVAPWEKGKPVEEDVAIAMTKDISEQGISLILPQPFHADQVLVGLWPPTSSCVAGGHKPTFVVGNICHFVRVGGGFFQVGIQFTELVDETDKAVFPYLTSKAAHLVPQSRNVCQKNYPSRNNLGMVC